MNKGTGLVLFWFFGVIVGCNSNPDQVKLKQYTTAGQQLYLQHCSNCHQEDGTGLRALYPPLVQSDYMIADPGRTICLISNGLEGPIQVNGLQYNLAMPSNTGLTPLEIAEITTYIMNTWGGNAGLVPITQVKAALDSCQ